VTDFVRTVRASGARTDVNVTIGIEAKILTGSGVLDVPPNYREADVIYVADHQLPWGEGPRVPREVRDQIADGRLSPAEVIERLIAATIAAMRRYGTHPLVLAHPFSILPKLGLVETAVPLDAIHALGAAAAETGTRVEISERWRCPEVRTARELRRAGARFVTGTDSHRAATIGQYTYVAEVAAALDDGR
jgi:putative hydrolase